MDKDNTLTDSDNREISCPACSEATLVSQKKDDLTVNYCPQCQGTWYDADELRDILGEAFTPQKIYQKADIQVSDRVCPVCNLSLSKLSFEFHSRSLKLDFCKVCEGYWMDKDIRNDPQKYFNPNNHETLKHYQKTEWKLNKSSDSINDSLALISLLFGLPVEGHNPRKNFPFVLLGILITGLLVFIFQLFSDSLLFQNWGLIPSNILEFKTNTFHTLFTYSFLHSSWVHLLGNFYILWIFGDNVQDIFLDHGKIQGGFLFILFYLFLSGISGLVHCLTVADNSSLSIIPLAGASGAVSGILACYVRLFPKVNLYQVFYVFYNKIPVRISINTYIILWILWNIALGLILKDKSTISWGAHLGGFFAGYFLCQWFLPYSPEKLHQ